MARYELDEDSLSVTQFVSHEAPNSIVLRALVRRSDDGRFHARLPCGTHQRLPDLHPVQVMGRLLTGTMRVVVLGAPPCALDEGTGISHSDDDVWEFDLRRPQGSLA